MRLLITVALGTPPKKYARKTLCFGSHGKSAFKSLISQKYVKFEPHIMPVIGLQRPFFGLFF